MFTWPKNEELVLATATDQELSGESAHYLPMAKTFVQLWNDKISALSQPTREANGYSNESHHPRVNAINNIKVLEAKQDFYSDQENSATSLL